MNRSMADFTVVFKRTYCSEPIVSNVYAIDNEMFLIADESGKFEWVFMDRCTLLTEE